MDRVNGLDWVDIGGGLRGFRSQNKLAGVTGTEVTAVWLNNAQEELLKVIEASGQVPDAGDPGQVWKGILRAVDNSMAFVPVLGFVSAPPGGPAAGDTYVIDDDATGAWAGHDQELARWSGAAWGFRSTSNGHVVGLPDGRVLMKIAGSYIDFLATEALAALARLATQAEVDDGVGGGVVRASTLMAKETKMLIGRANQLISAATTNVVVNPWTVEENTFQDSTIAAGKITVGAKDAGVWDFTATAQAPNTSGWVVAVWVHDITNGVYHGGPGFVTGGQGYTSGTVAAVTLPVEQGQQFEIVCSANGSGITLPIYFSMVRRTG